MSWKPRVLPGGASEGPLASGRPEVPVQAPSDADLVQIVLDSREQGGLPSGQVPGQEAFSELVRRHEARVLSVARYLLESADDARDVAQDAFLRVYRSLASYRPDQSFRNWLLRIAVNAAHDHRARRRLRLFRPLDEAESVGDPAASPDEVADQRIQLERVRQALVHLAPREREVFVLRDLEGLEVEEIAALLGVAEPTVRRHVALARLRLRQLLGAPAVIRDGH